MKYADLAAVCGIYCGDCVRIPGTPCRLGLLQVRSYVHGIPAREDERAPLPRSIKSCVLLPARLVFRTPLAIYSPSFTS